MEVGRNQAENPQRPRGAKLSRAALAALTALVVGAAPAQAGDGMPVHELDQSGVRSYWTPERMRAAEPLPAPAPDPDAAGGRSGGPAGEPMLVDPHAPGSAEVAEVRSASLAGAPQTRDAPVDRDEIEDPSAEPFRAHGKVFLTISGGKFPGDYVCSGTAINSLNRSTVWTAGHCVFDAEDGGGYATNWMFAPGYKNGATPFGEWPAKTISTTKKWRKRANLSYDLGAVKVRKNPKGLALNDVVGGRGIGFNQARHQSYQSFGYPRDQTSLEFTGGREFRCSADLGGADNPPGSGPSTNWIPCDMPGGSSGGGWVAGGSVLSVNSYTYCDLTGTICEDRLYGPYQERVAEKLYRSVAGEAQFCAGREVTHLGTSGNDRLVGTNGPDVFKALGGSDEVIGKRGRDRVCAGGGKDLVKGNAGKDKLKGQRGRDRLRGGRGRDLCNGGPGRDRAAGCERTRNVP